MTIATQVSGGKASGSVYALTVSRENPFCAIAGSGAGGRPFYTTDTWVSFSGCRTFAVGEGGQLILLAFEAHSPREARDQDHCGDGDYTEYDS